MEIFVTSSRKLKPNPFQLPGTRVIGQGFRPKTNCLTHSPSDMALAPPKCFCSTKFLSLDSNKVYIPQDICWPSAAESFPDRHFHAGAAESLHTSTTTTTLVIICSLFISFHTCVRPSLRNRSSPLTARDR